MLPGGRGLQEVHWDEAVFFLNAGFALLLLEITERIWHFRLFAHLAGPYLA